MGLLYGIALRMHRSPDEVRTWAYEDLINLVAYAKNEAEDLERKRQNDNPPAPSNGTTQVRRFKRK